jgi:hypothetical protein
MPQQTLLPPHPVVVKLMMSDSKPFVDYIINRRYADFRHGTGVQIKLFAGQLAEIPLHICWDVEQPVSDTYQPVCNLDTSLLKKWPFRRGRGLVAGTERKLGLAWNNPVRIEERLKKFAARKKGEARAYVIVASEEEAGIARRTLKVLNAQYVVNVMDYLHLGDTGLPEYPEFAALLKEAKKVFALTPPIQEVLSQISSRQDIAVLGVAREPALKMLRNFDSGLETLEIVMMGSIDYRRGLRELQKFCENLNGVGIRYSLNYIGTPEMRAKLGDQLPVNYRGVRLGTDRDALLQSMHLAYLPGPDGDPEMDCLARYSFPSRSTDYFWHGLPVLGPLFEESATAQMVADLRGRGVWFSPDARQLAAAVKNLVDNPRSWAMASEAVYDFAQKNFSIANTAQAILAAFDE